MYWTKGGCRRVKKILNDWIKETSSCIQHMGLIGYTLNTKYNGIGC